MDEQFQPLDNDEVLFISVGRVLMTNPTFKVGEFIDALAQAISDREDDWSDDNEGWFGEGLECESLRFGTRGWQRGKVRIRLEFCPTTDNKPPALEGRRETRREDTRREEVRREDTRREEIRRPLKPDPRIDNIYAVDEPDPDFETDFESDNY